MTLAPLGDSALVLKLGDAADAAMVRRAQALAQAIGRMPPAGVIETLAAFASVAVYYEVSRTAGHEALCTELLALALGVEGREPQPSRPIEIPVAYGGEFGPDLEAVAAHARCSPGEVVALHRAATYQVQAIGFVPGFPYLSGLPSALHMPRRATPRPLVPAGAVGIGGGQSGIYPLATPGGWNLIGRTPRRMFDPRRQPPALLHVGDTVVFREIDATELARAEAEEEAAGASAMPRGDCNDEAAGGATIDVLKPGMLTTVQDRGRFAHRASGVPVSGGADPFALRLANLLVGNPDDAAGLEFTLIGPELRFSTDVLIALAGAELDGLPALRPLHVAAGDTLRVGAARRGCRGYLAIAGGFDVPPVLGSRSTYLRGGFGGYDGRPLREGDRLRSRGAGRAYPGRWHLDARILPAHAEPALVRVVRGEQADEFDPAFLAGTLSYRVTPQSDRMGARLAGPSLGRKRGTELPSAPVVPGTVQVPPDGQPIVLLADAQTLGGYPQVAHVIGVDLPLIAQLRPGDAVRFREVSLGEAHQLAVKRERALALLREGLAQKYS